MCDAEDVSLSMQAGQSGGWGERCHRVHSLAGGDETGTVLIHTHHKH